MSQPINESIKFVKSIFEKQEFKRYPFLSFVFCLIIIFLHYNKTIHLNQTIFNFIIFSCVSSLLIFFLFLFKSPFLKKIRDTLGIDMDAICDAVGGLFKVHGEPRDVLQYLCRGRFNPTWQCVNFNLQKRFIESKKHTCKRDYCRFGPMCHTPVFLKLLKTRGLKAINFSFYLTGGKFTLKGDKTFNNKIVGPLCSWSVRSIGLVDSSDELAQKLIDCNGQYGFLLMPLFLILKRKIPAIFKGSFIMDGDSKIPVIYAFFKTSVAEQELNLKAFTKITNGNKFKPIFSAPDYFCVPSPSAFP